jgi:hypothetical protein
LVRLRLALGLALSLSCFVVPSSALADTPPSASTAPAAPPASPPPVSGIEVPEEKHSDAGRDFGNAVLWLPRYFMKFLYLGTSAAVAVMERSPVVPQVQDLFSTPDRRVFVLPTLAETGNAVSLGARLIIDLDVMASSIRVGFAGVNSFELETRVAFRLKQPLPSVISLEALYKRDNNLDYAGLGQVPRDDARNQFLPHEAGTIAEYFEERTRWIASYAVRPHKFVEIALSGSVNRRKVDDAVNAKPTLTDVFAAGTVPGAFDRYTVIYGEGAGRFDTRATRGRPSAGALAEAYVGPGTTFGDDPKRFVRYGGRLAGFIPIYRPTNILSPQIVADAVAPLDGAVLPFPELVHQPDFRGFDRRRDQVSLVGTLEYRWAFIGPLAMRVFFDTALVAPSWDAFDFTHTRWATGLMLDLHSDQTQIGQLGFSAAPDGVRLLLSLGVSSGYGDRQHQD